ncbi:MAG: hypothetical protein HPY66_3144 [Firmicutes bacterium]|nr:hypothetical protein [Bacillota bacterium]
MFNFCFPDKFSEFFLNRIITGSGLSKRKQKHGSMGKWKHGQVEAWV